MVCNLLCFLLALQLLNSPGTDKYIDQSGNHPFFFVSFHILTYHVVVYSFKGWRTILSLYPLAQWSYLSGQMELTEA